MSIAKQLSSAYAADMLGIILIILICIVFYAFIGFGADEAIQIMLVMMWGLLVLAIPVSFFLH